MLEIAARLFDPTGFVPRAQCGDWTPGLIWLHIGSDLFIWLAYLSIPLVLLYFTRRHDLPYPRLFVLFALFILACGFGHLIEALMFQYPLYRLSGAWKFLTAVVSWLTVLALIPVVPRVMAAVRDSTGGPSGTPEVADTTLHRLAAPTDSEWLRDYIVAILAAVMALLLRAAVDPIVESDHLYVLSLVAVVFVSWRSGFGPAIVTLLISLVGMIYFFVGPRYTFVVEGLSNQLATAMFFFCGVCCAGLGARQWSARQETKAALALALERKAELEVEVARRGAVELALREREAELTDLNDRLAAAQVRTAEALAQLESLVLNAPVAIAFLDPHLRCLRVNTAFADANGRPIADHLGRSLVDVVPDFSADLLGDFRTVLETGEPVLDRRFVAGPSSTTPGSVWRLNLFPVAGTEGGALGLGVIGQDVSEREHAADVLRESEERFRSMADSAPALIWLTELDERRTYFNKTWLEFTGRPLKEQLGHGWSESIHPEDHDRYLRSYTTAFASRRPFEIEYRLRRRDGVYRWVLARGTPRFTPSGAFAGFVGLCLDVTERREAVEAVRRSEERYRTLTEAIPQPVWNAGADGEVTYFNRRWVEFTDVPIETAAGRGWLSAVHPDDADRVYTAWRLTVTQSAVGAADRFTHEFRLRRASDGSYRWMLSVAVPLLRADGGVDQWIGAMADIDDQKRQAETLERMVRERTVALEVANTALVEEIEERKRAEQRVQAVATELTRSNQELEQFAYVASHDLQEPLRKIQAFGDRLKTKFRDALPEGGREHVDRMLASSGRMRRLIDDLLSYSRVTTLARPFVRTDLTRVAHEVVGDLSERIDETEADVRIGALPVIDADPMQMRQLFQNLIANAVKFHRPGVPPEVEVSAEVVAEPPREPGDEATRLCRITVRDNGIGFEEKYLNRIFQVFQRLHGREAYEGTGVGLAICRKIVERHGGTITAHSRVGEGTAFVVTLPVCHPASTDTHPAEPGG